MFYAFISGSELSKNNKFDILTAFFKSHWPRPDTMAKYQDWILALLPLTVVLIAGFWTLRNIPVLWMPCGILVSVSIGAFIVTER